MIATRFYKAAGSRSITFLGAQFDGVTPPLDIPIETDAKGPFVTVRTINGALRVDPGTWIIKRGHHPARVLTSDQVKSFYSQL